MQIYGKIFLAASATVHSVGLVLSIIIFCNKHENDMLFVCEQRCACAPKEERCRLKPTEKEVVKLRNPEKCNVQF